LVVIVIMKNEMLLAFIFHDQYIAFCHCHGYSEQGKFTPEG